MKTRFGFVSNSSVSSFIICGIYDIKPYEKIKNVIKNLLNNEDYNTFEDLLEDDTYDAFEFIKEKTKLDHYMNNPDEEDIYFGFDYDAHSYSIDEIKEIFEEGENIFGEETKLHFLLNDNS